MSTQQRQVTSVPHPATKVLSVEELYHAGAIPDAVMLLEHFKLEGRVSNELALRIIQDTSKVFKKEENVLDVPAPVTIVGDIHGQFFDLVKLFQVGGDPKSTRYLFLGDYVVSRQCHLCFPAR